MDSTFALLTDILKSRVCGTPTALPSLTLDEAKALYRLAKRHELAHIVGDALCHRGLLPDEKAEGVFEKESLRALYQSEQRERELAVFSQYLEENEIPFMPLKGAVLRALYPDAWLRNSCDIDVLIHEEDLSRAKALLLHHGYRLFGMGGHDVSFDAPSGVHIELHYRLIEARVLPGMEIPLENPWASAIPVGEGSYRYKMNNALLYYYHIAHMTKHYLFGGCGIRPFLDLWLLRHKGERDEDVLSLLLEEGGLQAFHRAACALAEVWFGEGVHSPLTKEMEEHVLRGGVYGSTENRVKVQQIKRGGKLRYALSRIFLPYRSLKFSYPVLEKHKWLYPICQVRRWFRLAFFGAKHSLRELHLNSALSEEESRKTVSHLHELGFQFD